jgi:steroid 5-alpha reductase family enzyme
LNRCDGKVSGGQVWGDSCVWGRRHPLYLVNVLFFLNVDVLFYIVGLFQGSFWLIDLYWTIIPVAITYIYALHPLEQSNLYRSRAVTALMWFWAIRLTYSYLRREKWQLGEQEDWRYAEYRRQFGRNWWWISFFYVFLSQQIFLVGITLPVYVVHQSKLPWNGWDVLATSLCFSGVFIAHVADTQLYHFVRKNQILKDIGGPKVPLLETGLWNYSRHPNYFGEQLFWWGLSIFAVNLGQSWAVIGTVLNSACLAYVTVLVERRMLKDESRAEIFRNYQKTTSVLIPWFKGKSAEVKPKTKSS